MRYTTYNDISATLRRNLHRLPPLRLVVGVPRSGMIPALMLAELLNIPCASLDDLLAGRMMSCGGRAGFMRENGDGRILVLDDTVYYGTSMRKVKALTKQLDCRFDIIYGCVYAEGKDSAAMVDFCFEDVYDPKERLNLYEWNILHHYPVVTEASMWDIDGLVCRNPPDDHNQKAYERYLPKAAPLIVPTTKIGAFVTYRLERYRDVTEQWLRGQGIDYGRLVMVDAPDRDARDRMFPPEEHKARAYKEAPWAELFVESDPRQAELIHRLCGKPVYCFEDGRMHKRD